MVMDKIYAPPKAKNNFRCFFSFLGEKIPKTAPTNGTNERRIKSFKSYGPFSRRE